MYGDEKCKRHEGSVTGRSRRPGVYGGEAEARKQTPADRWEVEQAFRHDGADRNEHVRDGRQEEQEGREREDRAARPAPNAKQTHDAQHRGRHGEETWIGPAIDERNLVEGIID